MTPGQQAILDARPFLDEFTAPALALVVEAWHDLDTCRPIGMVVGKIPWTAIDQWIRRRRDLDGEARAIVTRAIRYVDDLEFAERSKKSKPSGPPSAPRGPVARQAQGASR